MKKKKAVTHMVAAKPGPREASGLTTTSNGRPVVRVTAFNLTEIGERISRLRGKATQAEFAEKIGCHKNTLARYERGERMPDGEFILALNLALGVNPSWLLIGSGSPQYVGGQNEGERALGTDYGLLSDVIRSLEEMLDDEVKKLPYQKKASIISFAYERCILLGSRKKVTAADVIAVVREVLALTV